MTSLTVSHRCGSRTPTLRRSPAGESSHVLADEILAWVDAFGMSLFDWQRDVLRDALAVGPSMKWVSPEVGLVVPRQNGKNEILIALEVASIVLLGTRLVVHSAHEVTTATKHFVRMQELAEQLPEFRKVLPNTKSLGFFTSNGKEHIRFRNGARIDFKARSRGSGRGFSADLIVLDEAFDLSPRAVGNMRYTLRARPNPQTWMTSSPAHRDSVVLHSLRTRAEQDDEDDRLLYAEWANEPDADLSSPDTWYRVNPSMGLETSAGDVLIEERTVRDEYVAAAADPDLLAEFAREACGIAEPPDSASVGVINLETWGSLAQVSQIETDRQWALAVSPDRKWAALAVAGTRADGLVHVEWMDHRSGTRWVEDRVVDGWEAKRIPLRIRRAGPEASFIDPLRKRGVEVVEVSAPEYAQATGRLLDAVTNRTLRHLGQPSLDKAVEAADLSTSKAGASTWVSSGDISTLEAVTVALGGVAAEPPAYEGGFFVDLDEFVED